MHQSTVKSCELRSFKLTPPRKIQTDMTAASHARYDRNQPHASPNIAQACHTRLDMVTVAMMQDLGGIRRADLWRQCGANSDPNAPALPSAVAASKLHLSASLCS